MIRNKSGAVIFSGNNIFFYEKLILNLHEGSSDLRFKGLNFKKFKKLYPTRYFTVQKGLVTQMCYKTVKPVVLHSNQINYFF